MMQHIRAAFLFSVTAVALCSFAPSAAASDTYPGAVRDALDMPCAPPCTLCHDTLSGGLGTANQPFGEAIRATVDLPIRQPEVIPAALKRMQDGPDCTYELNALPESGRCDSDGDLMGDIAELVEGRDPNVAGVGNLCGGPTYGCGARVARGSADFDWVSLLMAGAAAVTLIHSARRMRKRA